MAIFFRIYNDNLYPVSEVDRLGFTMDDPAYIPTEYLDNKEFVVFRTCWGLGDWGIISAMPRLLKEKYPDCKVYLPTNRFMETVFGSDYKHNWSSWSDSYKNRDYVFDNNPYIDGFTDSVKGEVFHDHFRLAACDDEPLLRQMLRFWQFEEEEMDDLCPELYFSDEEIVFGDSIINEYSDGKYGTLLISERFNNNAEWISKLQHQIDVVNLPMFYWTNEAETPFKFKKILDLRHIHPRIQLYLKTKAQANIGLQCGVNDTVARYAPTYSLARGELGTNNVKCQHYIK